MIFLFLFFIFNFSATHPNDFLVCTLFRDFLLLARMGEMAIKCGPMIKRSQNKKKWSMVNYKHRWFELIPPFLIYYDNCEGVREVSLFFDYFFNFFPSFLLSSALIFSVFHLLMSFLFVCKYLRFAFPWGEARPGSSMLSPTCAYQGFGFSFCYHRRSIAGIPTRDLLFFAFHLRVYFTSYLSFLTPLLLLRLSLQWEMHRLPASVRVEHAQSNFIGSGIWQAHENIRFPCKPSIEHTLLSSDTGSALVLFAHRNLFAILTHKRNNFVSKANNFNSFPSLFPRRLERIILE